MDTAQAPLALVAGAPGDRFGAGVGGVDAQLEALEAPALETPPPAGDERAEAALEGIRRELGSGG